MNVAGKQSAAFEVAKLVEHEQRVTADAGVMAVQLLLPARGRLTLESMSRPSAMREVDPPARQVGKSSKFLGAASNCVSKRPSGSARPRLMLQFRGSVVTSDAGLLAYRELDDARRTRLAAMASDVPADARTGKNGRHALAGLFRHVWPNGRAHLSLSVQDAFCWGRTGRKQDL